VKDYLRGLPWFLLAVTVAVSIGYLIERWRRQKLQGWAAEQGGTFEGGGILDEVVVPEAAAFDAYVTGSDKVTYNNVTRIVRPEATYTLARFYRHYLDTKNSPKSFSCVVCFVTLPVEMPPVTVYRPVTDILGIMPERVKLALPDALPEFSVFDITLLSGHPAPTPDALRRLLPAPVQRELLDHPTLISGLHARGQIVRVQAAGQVTGYPHREVFEVARRLAAAWR
jgi:hypothetical protein